MQRYNLALLPVDDTSQDLFKRLAQDYFAADQDGYVLADNALAHTTLCQFRAPHTISARTAFTSFADKKNEQLRIKELRICAGSGEHKGFFWAWLMIEPTPSLLDMQKKCVAHLAARGFEVFTPVESYAPHITLARLSAQPRIAPAMAEFLPNYALAFRPVLGVSTENGLLVREL